MILGITMTVSAHFKTMFPSSSEGLEGLFIISLDNMAEEHIDLDIRVLYQSKWMIIELLFVLNF